MEKILLKNPPFIVREPVLSLSKERTEEGLKSLEFFRFTALVEV